MLWWQARFCMLQTGPCCVPPMLGLLGIYDPEGPEGTEAPRPRTPEPFHTRPCSLPGPWPSLWSMKRHLHLSVRHVEPEGCSDFRFQIGCFCSFGGLLSALQVFCSEYPWLCGDKIDCRNSAGRLDARKTCPDPGAAVAACGTSQRPKWLAKDGDLLMCQVTLRRQRRLCRRRIVCGIKWSKRTLAQFSTGLCWSRLRGPSLQTSVHVIICVGVMERTENLFERRLPLFRKKGPMENGSGRDSPTRGPGASRPPFTGTSW